MAADVVDYAALRAKLCIDEDEEERRMQAGSPVILFAGFGAMHFVPALQAGAVACFRVGSFNHDDCIGKVYGSRIKDRKSGRWVAALQPIPHFLTEVLPHRTQIIYHADIYALLMMLDVRPGSVVLESGTGSASMTCHLAQAVFPHGRVHTFEFHQARFDQAHAMLRCLPRYVSSTVTCYHRDVYTNGFSVNDPSLDISPAVSPAAAAGSEPAASEEPRTAAAAAPGMTDVGEDDQGHTEPPPADDDPRTTTGTAYWADAVFLDLPQPWRALPHAQTALKAGGRLCSFSPCIEQVQRTERWLVGQGFRRESVCLAGWRTLPHRSFCSEIRVFEALAKGWATLPAARGSKRRKVAATPVGKEEDAHANNNDTTSKKRPRDGECALAGDYSSSTSSWDLWGRRYDQQQFACRGHTAYLLMACAPPAEDGKEEKEEVASSSPSTASAVGQMDAASK